MTRPCKTHNELEVVEEITPMHVILVCLDCGSYLEQITKPIANTKLIKLGIIVT